MPELPEVETLRRGLDRALSGKRITRFETLMPKMLKPPVEDPERMARLLVGRRIETVERRGKHLIFVLENGYSLYAHLKMRGQMLVVPEPQVPRAPYLCFTCDFDNGSQWRFHDMWTWGELRLLNCGTDKTAQFVPALATMGAEPLAAEFTMEVLWAGASRRGRSAIKACLLDQDVVAGVGNIYADEALHRAAIQPQRRAESLTPGEWHRLTDEIRAVLNEAVAAGGTTSDEYVDADGRQGAYAPRVYGRANQPCGACGECLTRI